MRPSSSPGSYMRHVSIPIYAFHGVRLKVFMVRTKQDILISGPDDVEMEAGKHATGYRYPLNERGWNSSYHQSDVFASSLIRLAVYNEVLSTRNSMSLFSKGDSRHWMNFPDTLEEMCER